MLKLVLVVTVAASLVAPQLAHGLMMCGPKKLDGTLREGASIKLRTACRSNELQLDPVALGLQGPPGPDGPQGPQGTNLRECELKYAPSSGFIPPATYICTDGAGIGPKPNCELAFLERKATLIDTAATPPLLGPFPVAAPVSCDDLIGDHGDGVTGAWVYCCP